jgi:hypothetical protein
MADPGILALLDQIHAEVTHEARELIGGQLARLGIQLTSNERAVLDLALNVTVHITVRVLAARGMLQVPPKR